MKLQEVGAAQEIGYRRHPRGWCGLKWVCDKNKMRFVRSPPARVVWIEMMKTFFTRCGKRKSPPARVVWIEILMNTDELFANLVATREGGVD